MGKQSYATDNVKYWAVSDFETTTPNTDYKDQHDDGRVILASTIYWDEELLKQYNADWTDEQKKEWKSKFRIDRSVSIEEWWKNIKSKGENQTIFFHNLAFDGYAILAYFNKLGFKPYDDIMRNRGVKFKHNMYKYFLRGNNILWLKVKYLHHYRDKHGNKQHKECVVWFRCSKILLQAPIATLGNGVKIAKHNEEDTKQWSYPNETRIREFYDREPAETLEEFKKQPGGERYIEYCDNDVFIALISLWRFKNSFDHITEMVNEWKTFYPSKEFNILKECFTSAQIAKLFGKLGTRLWMKEEFGQCLTGDENIYWECSVSQYQFMKQWMRGGLTQINHKFLGVGGDKSYIGKGMMIDITSDYPAQMVKYSLPYGKVYTSSEFDFEGVENVDFVCFLSVRVKSVKLRKEYENFPCYPNRTGNGDKILAKDPSQPRYLVDCNIEHQAFFTKREWEVLNKYYEIKYDNTSIESYYMKAAPYMKKSAFELFKIKEENKNDEGRKLGAKIAVNAMYGATCVRDSFDSGYFLDDETLAYLGLPIDKVQLREQMFKKPDERPLINISYYNDNKEYQFRTYDRGFSIIGKNFVKFHPLDAKEKATNIATGAYITSMARCYLMETLLDIGVEHFLLCDTDSICLGFLDDAKIEYIKNKYCAKSSYLPEEYLGLGSWDVEFVKDKPYYDGIFTHFQTTGAKQYALWKYVDDQWIRFKFKMAGVSYNASLHHIMNPSELYCMDDYGISLYYEFDTQERVVNHATKDKIYYPSVILLQDTSKKVKLTK